MIFKLIPQAHAQIPIENWFNIGGQPASKYPELAAFLQPIILDVFVIATIIFFILLVVGGLMYVINAGSGDKDGMEKGKGALTASVFGLIIIFAAYWTIQIVEYITGIEIFFSGL
ncbi:hypothetical protein HY345_00645 [Candidatus Microgenomates bacterium]|nr:hypothetical protein [Candidatus Microgenomates bacterium]